MTQVTHSIETETRLNQRLANNEHIDLEDILAVGIIRRYPVFSFGYDRCDGLTISTDIYYQDYETGEDENEGVVIGSMELLRLISHTNNVELGDAIDQETYNTAQAIEEFTNPLSEDFIEELLEMQDLYLLKRFDLKPQYQKKRLGHKALFRGLQASGCEGHHVVITPSELDKDAGKEFLIKFYLAAAMPAVLNKERKVICYPLYNCHDYKCRLKT